MAEASTSVTKTEREKEEDKGILPEEEALQSPGSQNFSVNVGDMPFGESSYCQSKKSTNFILDFIRHWLLNENY